MDIAAGLLILVIGLITGYIISHLRRSNNSSLLEDKNRQLIHDVNESRIAHARLLEAKQSLLQQFGQVEGNLQATQQELLTKSKLLQDANKEREVLLATRLQLESAEQRLLQQKKDLEDFRKAADADFRLLANSIMEEKSQTLNTLNSTSLKHLLEPLQLNLKEFKQKIEDTYLHESRERFSLEKKLHELIGLNKQLGEEASNLTQALKYNNKAQGNWGEMILESLLEFSGLTKGREYFIQEFLRDEAGNVIKDDEGKSLQPDVRIHFPDDRKIIVDSKMSLVAYERYTSAVNEDERAIALKDHLRSLRQHIDSLHKKNYPKSAGLALDHVILFIPVEPAFMLAIKEDAQLWRYAYEKRVLLVSATNLLAVLKIIADVWKVEKQSQHAIDIANNAGKLYDKFVSFADSMDSIGNHLHKASESYENAMKKLSEGKGNIVRQISQLKTMGAKAEKQLPDKLVKRSLDDNMDE